MSHESLRVYTFRAQQTVVNQHLHEKCVYYARLFYVTIGGIVLILGRYAIHIELFRSIDCLSTGIVAVLADEPKQFVYIVLLSNRIQNTFEKNSKESTEGILFFLGYSWIVVLVNLEINILLQYDYRQKLVCPTKDYLTCLFHLPLQRILHKFIECLQPMLPSSSIELLEVDDEQHAVEGFPNAFSNSFYPLGLALGFRMFDGSKQSRFIFMLRFMLRFIFRRGRQLNGHRVVEVHWRAFRIRLSTHRRFSHFSLHF